LYALSDTVLSNGDKYEILKYSTDPSRAVYDASLAEVGANKGYYRVTESVVNGRIYEWVAPLNGVPQGNYEPREQVFLPDK
jgi:hypothetical protein